jgi:protease I
MTEISSARVLIMASDGFEHSELMQPLTQLRAAGAHVDIAAPKPGPIRSWKDDNWGDSIPTDMTLDQVNAAQYDALVIPGGLINPDKLRLEAKAIEIVNRFVDGGQVVAAICHGPWLLAEADVIDGLNVTSWRSIRTDLENAGGEWRDEAVVTDEGIITSRSPEDLPAFIAKIIEEIHEGKHQRSQAA